MASIKEVLNLCQKGGRIDPYVKMLKKLYSDKTHGQFVKEYFQLLKRPLAFNGPDSLVNRIIQLTMKFSLQLNEAYLKNSSEDEDALMHPFLQDLLEFLMKASRSVSYTIRSRALNILGKILSQLSELNCEEHLLEKLYQTASYRLRDMSSNVRAEAVLASCYLQDPANSSCPVFQDLLLLLSRDPHYISRRNVAEVIVISRNSIDPIKERLLDIHPSVKKMALTRISEKVSVRCFSIMSRVNILETCYEDSVLKGVLKDKLLPSWLKEVDGDFVKFLCLLDVQSSPKIIRECLYLLFEQDDLRSLASKLDLDPNLHVIQREKLNDETVFFWLSLCQYVKMQKSDFALDMFDELTPTLSDFCDYLERFVQDIKECNKESDMIGHLFIFKQLLLLAEEMDFDDSFGAKRFKALVIETLTSSLCLFEMIESLVGCLRLIHVNDDEFLTHVAEISLELCGAVLNPDAELNENELRRLVKGLKVAVCALKITPLRNSAPQLHELKRSVLTFCCALECTYVRLEAFEAIGLYSLHDIEEASENHFLLMQALHYDDDVKVQVVVLKSIFDILLNFGSKFLNNPASDEAAVLDASFDLPSTSPKEKAFIVFYEKLIPFLDSKNDELRSIAVCGMGKLMLRGRVTSAPLFSRLFLMCYNPLYLEDINVRQFLTSFLPAYAASSHLPKECMEDAVMIALENIFEAPSTSAMSEIDPYTVGIALLQLSRLIKSAVCKTGNRIHDHLASRLLEKILSKPKASCVPVLTRILNHLELTGRHKEELIDKTEDVLSKVKNKIAIRNLTKFNEKIGGLEALNSSSFFKLEEENELFTSAVSEERSVHQTRSHLSSSVETEEAHHRNSASPVPHSHGGTQTTNSNSSTAHSTANNLELPSEQLNLDSQSSSEDIEYEISSTSAFSEEQRLEKEHSTVDQPCANILEHEASSPDQIVIQESPEHAESDCNSKEDSQILKNSSE